MLIVLFRSEYDSESNVVCLKRSQHEPMCLESQPDEESVIANFSGPCMRVIEEQVELYCKQSGIAEVADMDLAAVGHYAKRVVERDGLSLAPPTCHTMVVEDDNDWDDYDVSVKSDDIEYPDHDGVHSNQSGIFPGPIGAQDGRE